MRGTTRIEGYLDAADTRATLAAVRRLRAEVTESRTGGGGPRDGHAASVCPAPGTLARNGEIEIDVGNAGTLLRLLPGWLARDGRRRVDARRRRLDPPPARRPRRRAAVDDERGVAVATGGFRCASGARSWLGSSTGCRSRARRWSCVLLAGLLADGATTVVEPAPTRDHTERMLAAAGADLRVDETTVAVRVRPRAGSRSGRRVDLAAGGIAVPGDFSSAAFLIVAALVVPGSDVRIENVGLSPTRIGLLGVLHRMGAAAEVEEDGAAEGGFAARCMLVGPLGATRVGASRFRSRSTSSRSLPFWVASPRGRRWRGGAEELRVYGNRTGSPGSSTGFAGSAPRSRKSLGRLRSRGAAGQGGALDARGDHRLAMLGAIASRTSLARRRRGRRNGVRRRQLPRIRVRTWRR